MPASTPTYPAIATVASGSRVVLVVSKGPLPSAPAGYAEIPDVVGSTQGSALKSLQDAGFNARAINDYSASVARGQVIGQLPAAGSTGVSGADVTLLVSSGSNPTPTTAVVLPEVVGRTEAEAIAALEAAGLSAQATQDYSPSVPAGIVVSQLPSRASLAAAPAQGSKWVGYVIAAVALVMIAVIAYLGLRSTARVEVPDVVGMTRAEAVAEIEEADLRATVVAAEDPGDADPDTVVAQSPEAGSTMQPRGNVTIEVAPAEEEAEQVRVPNVRGMSQAEAIGELTAVGLAASTETEESADVGPGEVLAQDPAGGSQVDIGSEVVLTIAKAPASTEVKVPDVTGETQADAENTLANVGLETLVVESESFDVPEGDVISQQPAAGSAATEGDSVALLVSTGAPQDTTKVTVPNVVGEELADAQETLAKEGLKSTAIEAAVEGEGQVIAQSPAAGSSVPTGSFVILLHAK